MTRPLTVLVTKGRPFHGVRFVATCSTCGGRISPDQVMCTGCALSSTARA